MADGSGGGGSDGQGGARPRVVIAGAGVAGLAAAHVLADAGLDVTVLEKASVPGGRCLSYVDEALGHTVEHGIHGVFPRYANLVALFRDAEIPRSVFRRTTTTGLAGPDGTMRSTELADARGPAPFFLTRMVPRGVLRLRDYALALPLLARAYALAEEGPEVASDTTFASLLDDAGVTSRMAKLLLLPYVRNLAYARGDEVSAQFAAEALSYYVLEHADAVKAEWVDGGMVPLVFQPWQAALEAKGVRFRFDTPITSVVMEGDAFRAFATRAVITERELGDREKLLTTQLGARFVALNWKPSSKSLLAWDGACTHAGCRLSVEAAAPRVFHCACHGGQFDEDGNVLKAPPTRPLKPIPLRREAATGTWIVEGGAAAAADDADDGFARADFGVVALDLGAFQDVLPRALALHPSTEGVPFLRTTSVAVLRMRFRADGGAKWRGPDSGVFAADDFLDNFFALHTMQREFEAMDDLFLECHVGESDGLGSWDDDDVYDRAVRVLDGYFPDERLSARLDRARSRVLRHERAFTLFAPGDVARAPTSSDGRRPNLMLAGDWVRPDDPAHRSFFMERAAVTGIEAANAILRALGRPEAVRPVARPELPPLGKLLGRPLAAFGRARAAIRRALG